MNKWNEDQLMAIETTDRGVVVSAAAGSGKTTVLIERTIRMLSDVKNQIPADKLLAVTFTVDAATQLKQKLSKAFEKKLLEECTDEEKKWLHNQQDKLPLAKISTINSFCLELVKNNIHKFEYQDGVKIIDENDAEIILKRSFEKALDILAEKNRDKFNLLYEKLSKNGADGIIKNGRKLYEFLRSLPFPEEWVKNVQSSFENETLLSNWIETASYEYMSILEKAMKYNEKALYLAEKLLNEYDYPKKNIEVLNDDIGKMNKLKISIENGDWERMVLDCQPKFKSFSIKISDKDLPPDYPVIHKKICNLRDDSKKLIKSIKDKIGKIGEDIKTPLKESKTIFEALYEYCKIAEEIAYKEKLHKNALEFSDVERMALELLVQYKDGKIIRTSLAQELADNKEYQIILIDEFQDVNNLQDLIFKSLSDTDDLSILGKNVFVVGDVKQSIYRFRQSNPQLFINAKSEAVKGENKEKLALVELKKNYRSRKSVIDFVNLLFAHIMSEEIGELKYEGGEKLRLGADYSGNDPLTEVIFIDNISDKESTSDEDEEGEEEICDDENYAIAQRIRQMIDEKTMVRDSSGNTRPCRPGDFCILYRAGKAVSSLPQALDKFKLKSATEKGEGYLRSREITIMLNLLRIIDNPMKDIPMASVMMSPLFGFTADELAKIRLLCKRENGGYNHLYQIIAAIGQKEENVHSKETSKIDIGNEVLESKCMAVKNMISQFGFYSSGMTLTKLIRRIYDETEMLAAASVYENSIQKRANLRMLLEYAQTYQDNSDGSVTGFIRYLESISESGKDFAQALTVMQNDDSVILKTIHASKGLEFPFVFLCGLNKSFNKKDLQNDMLLDEYRGAGFQIYDHDNMTMTKTISHEALGIIGKNKLYSEEMRLLYVALTRAKEKIVIPVNIKRKKDGSSKIIEKIKKLANDIALSGGINSEIIRSHNSYLEWIFSVLLCCDNNEKLLEKFEIDTELPAIQADIEISYIESNIENMDNKDDIMYINGTANEEKVTELITKFLYNEKNISEPVASKLTVTEIVATEKEKELGEKNPEFFPQLPCLSDELSKLSSAQKGTCTHLFMELADYSNAEKSVRMELDRLTQRGFFTEKEASGIYVNSIEKFFAGDFYKRMKKSEHIEREKKFLVCFSDLELSDKYSEYMNSGSMLQGIADCIFRENDGYVLVDYKTDNFKEISELYNYKTQLELYKAALDKILDIPVKACYIYSFKLNEGLEINLNT